MTLQNKLSLVASDKDKKTYKGELKTIDNGANTIDS